MMKFIVRAHVGLLVVLLVCYTGSVTYFPTTIAIASDGVYVSLSVYCTFRIQENTEDVNCVLIAK